MKSIETGVDKLLALVNKEKKIEIRKASKALGVPEDVVQEWAEFLEEEKLITLEYSLSKIYLSERRLSKTEVEKKTKEYNSKKEVFTRKVDTTLKKLERDTAGFEEIKKQYYDLKEEIGGEIEQVKGEVDELRHYEDLKKNIDREILKQKSDYESTLNDVHKRITAEERRYGKIHEEIVKEAVSLESEKQGLNHLKDQEDALSRRLDALRTIIDDIKKQLNTEEADISHHEERIGVLKNLADGLDKDIRLKREKELKPLLESSTTHQEKIIKIQADIFEKVKNRKKQIAEHESQGLEIAKRFEKFFEKKLEAERIVVDLEKQKALMKKELEDLISQARSFDLGTKDANSKKHIKDLEAKFAEFDKRQHTFLKRLDLLSHFITGK